MPMHQQQPLLDTIHAITAALDTKKIRKVLLLYEEKISFIGDCCKRFDKLSYVREFLNNASITINFQHPENQKFYEGLLKNNPAIDQITTNKWEEIAFDQYDLLYCIAYNEERILGYLDSRYGERISAGQYEPAVYSLSSLILKPILNSNYIFPVHTALVSDVSAERPGRLYISRQEQEWANNWLYNKGLQRNEDIYILVDSTTAREKLMDITVYFDVLAYILEHYAGRILIFDEGNIGKEEFYAGWMGEEAMQRIIVSKGLSLRENLCLIGSTHTKLVLGPCTGLMHCASGIYNNFAANGLLPQHIPVLITYTGEYAAENVGAHFWWGSSPLINCLLIKKVHNRKTLVELSSLSADQQQRNDSLPCSDYTAPMLIDYLKHKLHSVQSVAAQL